MSGQGGPVVRLGTVKSTMIEAAALAQAGCVHGTAVVAEEQTAGMGRHGHSWHSELGVGLYVSLVLRLPLGPEELPLLTLALGIAMGEAISHVTGVSCDLRWPNDILTGGKKVAGILVQVVDNAAIAGIGVNVNHTRFPPELEGEATSLRMVTGREIDREALLQKTMRSVEDLCQVLVSGGRDAILDLFTSASSFARGKVVRVESGGGLFQGVTDGLTSQGFLRVRKADGSVETVVSGGVRPA